MTARGATPNWDDELELDHRGSVPSPHRASGTRGLQAVPTNRIASQSSPGSANPTRRRHPALPHRGGAGAVDPSSRRHRAAVGECSHPALRWRTQPDNLHRSMSGHSLFQPASRTHASHQQRGIPPATRCKTRRSSRANLKTALNSRLLHPRSPPACWPPR